MGNFSNGVKRYRGFILCDHGGMANRRGHGGQYGLASDFMNFSKACKAQGRIAVMGYIIPTLQRAKWSIQ